MYATLDYWQSLSNQTAKSNSKIHLHTLFTTVSKLRK